jgi:NAD(P)-dependent dehydrogenase (short-subunit alcohol dehydrogenase family)
MLMRTIAVELAAHNITVNNIALGALDTPMDAPSKRTRIRCSSCFRRYRLGGWGNRKR